MLVNQKWHWYLPSLSFLCSSPTGLGHGDLNLAGGSNLLFHAERSKKGGIESKAGSSVLLCKAVACQHLECCMWLESHVSRQAEQEEAWRRTAGRQSEPFPWNRVSSGNGSTCGPTPELRGQVWGRQSDFS